MPKSPTAFAEAARACVREGARVIHLHPYDSDGRETLTAGPCGAAVRAVRDACPGVPISLTTFAAIEADPRRRLQTVSQWEVLPELVTANMGSRASWSCASTC